MTREELIDALATRYGVCKNEDGSWDMDDGVWDRGCYLNGRWFSLLMVADELYDLCD